MSSTDPSPSTVGAPADVVMNFLEAWARYDLDAVFDLVTEDIVYANVSLPTIYGRDRLERLARPIMRPDRLGFKAYVHHVAADGDVVLTDRTDELTFRRFKALFWVYGRFVVHGDKIAVWRDSFDWLDVTVGNVRGLLGLAAPQLNRRVPAG